MSDATRFRREVASLYEVPEWLLGGPDTRTRVQRIAGRLRLWRWQLAHSIAGKGDA
jgi:hypothetical protein